MAGYRLFEHALQAELYLRFRPEYPKETIETIINFLTKKKKKPLKLAIDIGCGGGQSTRPLASHFEKVIGFDVSEAQVENAQKGDNAPNVEYRIGGGEKIDLPNSCVDLITCAQSAHWFNYPIFCKEADRVLTPQGCLALYGYGCPIISVPDKEIEDKLNAEQNQLYSGTLGEYWADRRKDIENHYADFVIPYDENERVDSLEISKPVTVSGLIGYLRTWSAYWTYVEKHPHSRDPLVDHQNKIMEILNVDTSPDTTPLTVKAPVFLLQGRKPTS
ncbi:putative methyltransferase DDB_G0268948 [Amphiura filiformis]|uniref:putative methyltransferase DDB_G0268948 n=1 Tax=Amphiura filiformis TaxID=82378 RepID=UPI003B21BB91